MDALSAEQYRRNELSRSAWDLYQPHRDHVTELLLSLVAPGSNPELCILGAGNCNDVDLNRLLSVVRRVHLVDLDADALLAGVAAQHLAGDARIELHGRVDLTGAINQLVDLSPSADPEVVAELASRLANLVPFRLPNRCELVASIGLISQLVELAVKTVGTAHPQFLRLTQALRTQHLRLLFELTKPDGKVMLTSEIVSSDTAPEILREPESQLPQVITQLLNASNFFTGLHPGILLQSLQTDERIASQLKSVRLTTPWLWPFVARTYACCAILAQRQHAPASE